MSIDLDAGTTPPRGVDHPSRLTVFVGDPPRQLSIFAGVAIADFRSGGDLDRDECRVRLGITTTEFFTWTASAALAAISNEDSDFIFANDAATVDVDPADGVLRLKVAVAAQGEPATLIRFSYTVHVLSDPVQARITGQISWEQAFGGPTFLVSKGGKPMFRVDLGQTVNVPVAPGSFPQTKFVVQTSGFSSPPVAAGSLWVAAYEIDNVPFGQAWEVRPSLLAGTLAGPPQPFDAAPGFQPNPQVVQLALSHPSASGVDFTMIFSNSAPR